MSAKKLACTGCGEEPFWGLPQAGDLCLCGRGKLVLLDIPTPTLEDVGVRAWISKTFGRSYMP